MARTASRAFHRVICSDFQSRQPDVLYYVVLAASWPVFSDLPPHQLAVRRGAEGDPENDPRAISLGYKTDQYKLLAYILSGR